LSGQYKNTADVPDIVDSDKLHKARTWGRIRVNVVFIGIAIVLCCGTVFFGKN